MQTMLVNAADTTAIQPLPAIHPGTPGFGWVTVNGMLIVRETDKAVQFARDNGRTSWLPKSAIRFSRPQFIRNSRVTVEVRAWFYSRNFASM